MNSKPFEALGFLPFRRYISIRFFINMAFRMQELVLGFYIYKLTHDPLAIGMIGLVELIPFLGFVLFGGYFADRSEKRKTLFWVFSGYLFSSITIFFLVQTFIPLNLALNNILTILYGMFFLNGISSAFLNPCWFILLKKSVPEKIFANANTWNSSSRQVAAVLGPALGGLIYGFWGISTAMAFVITFIFLSIGWVFFLEKHPPEENISPSPNRNELFEGIYFVWNNKLMLSMLTLDLFAYFFGGMAAMLPVYAQDILKVGSQGFGLMRSFLALGSIFSLMIMTKFSPLNKPWKNLIGSVFGFGISVMGFALSKNYNWTLLFLFSMGAFDSIGGIIRSTIMSLITPSNIGGRVSSINSIFLGCTNELGEFESGFSARLMGIVPSVVFGGAITLIAATYSLFRNLGQLNLSLEKLQESNV